MKGIYRFGFALAASLSIVGTSQADITLLHRDPDGHHLWSPVHLGVQGRYRIRARDYVGQQDNDNYWHKFNNNGTWAALDGSYTISPSFKIISYWRLAIDTFRIMRFRGHYPENRQKFKKQTLYVGFDSDKYGRLTIGQQKTVYRNTIGGPTDLWQNDWHARAEASGVNSKYDGSYRTDRNLYYELDRDSYTLYANLFFPSKAYHAPGFKFKRDYGAALGAKYKIQDNLSISGSYTLIKAYTYDKHFHDGSRDTLHEQLLGGNLTWRPGHWWFSASGLYLGDFVLANDNQYKKGDKTKHLIGNAYGLIGFASYILPIEKGPLTDIWPYFAVTHMKYTTDQNYYKNTYSGGINFDFPHNTRVTIEHTFADSSLPGQSIDSTWFNFQIVFK